MVTFIGSLFALCACNLEPQSLLGKTPSGKDSMQVTSRPVCDKKYLTRMAYGTELKLTTPDDIDSLLVSVEKAHITVNANQINLTIKKMVDGNFPLVEKVTYKRKGSGAGVSRPLLCKMGTFNDDPQYYRGFACVIVRQPGDRTWENFEIDSVVLKNEKCTDANCTAKATFVAGFRDSSCASENNSNTRVTTIIGNQTFPELYPTDSQPSINPLR